jgi:hypothetical protein
VTRRWLTIPEVHGAMVKAQAGERVPDQATLRRWCKRGHLPCRRLGKLWEIDMRTLKEDRELKDVREMLVDMVNDVDDDAA